MLVSAWDFADPAATRTTMRTRAEAAAEPAERLVWLTQVARASGLLGDTEEATQTLTAVDRAVDNLPAGDRRRHVMARSAIERGRVLNTGGDPAAAEPYFTLAAQHARECGLDGLTVDALHMTAIVAGRLNGPEESRVWNARALDLAESSPDPAARRWRASLLNNLGWDRHEAGHFKEALGYFERALVIRRSEQDPSATHVAEWSVARAMRSLGRYDEALARQERLTATPAGADDGYVHEEIGECLLALRREREAAAAFARALALLGLDTWLVEHEPERLARLARLAGSSG
jgi:tetratricopeptide (TPR) repeat protein